MREVAIVAAKRTPIGRHGGELKSVRPDDLAALILRQVVEDAHLDPVEVDDVLFGAANQAGEDNRNVARMALLLAGFPVSVPGATYNRLCGSSLETINRGFQAIRSGEADIIIAGGVEKFTSIPTKSISRNGPMGNPAPSKMRSQSTKSTTPSSTIRNDSK